MPSATPLAVVTGGARGIGAATARRFAKLGHAVGVLDVNAELGTALAAQLTAEGSQAVFIACDVSDAAAVEAAAQSLEARFGAPRVLVTAAALIPDTDSILEMDLETHDRMWRVNYHGSVHAARSFGRRMVAAAQGGAIVTLGSINSLAPMPLPAYNITKAAIARLTELLALEMGPHGIRANCVAPTYVMTDQLRARVDAGLRDLGRMMAVHALDDLPTPEDIADAIVFLCSPQARTITGVLLPVDAGWAGGVSYMTYAGGVPDIVRRAGRNVLGE